MKSRPFWRTAARIALRDLRSGRRHFLIALASLAAGVATMTASRAVSAEFARHLRGDMRQWIAADAAVALRQAPSDEQTAAIAGLERQGIEATESLETYGMAASDQAADPALVSVKSVDPFRYPWYGSVRLEPGVSLQTALQADSLVISRTLAERLAVGQGDRLRLNGAEFRVAAILAFEPDRLAAAPNAFPRVILSAAAFAHGQIARAGNAITWRLLFRRAEGAGGRLKDTLRAIFPDAQILDYRGLADPRFPALLDTALTWLDLIAWMALALGALCVAVVVRLHIDRRLDSVAIMKALGGRWRQVICIDLWQIAILSLAGCGLGLLLAVPLERAVLWAAPDRIPFLVRLPWSWARAGESLLLGVLATYAAAIVPLFSVRRVPPLLVLRRYAGPPPAWHRGIRMAMAISLFSLVALFASTMHGWPAGLAFLSALAAGGVVLLGAGRAAIALSGRAAAACRTHIPAVAFHAMANLARPGSRAAARFVALSAAIMVVEAAWLGPGAVTRAIDESLPLHGADLLVLGLGPSEIVPLNAFLAAEPGVRQPIDTQPVATLQLSSIAGRPAPASAPERWVATCTTDAPRSPLTAGRWWHVDAGETETVMAESLAGMAGVKPEDTIALVSGGKRLQARVVGLRRLDAVEELRGGLIFPCAAFTGLAVSYDVGISLQGVRAAEVRKSLAARFPAFPVIAREELAAAIDALGQDAIGVLRISSLFVLVAGTAVLTLLFVLEERSRASQIAILKALGARPSQVRNGLLAEFASLGLLAGAGGGAAGSLAGAMLLSLAFRRPTVAWDAAVLAGAVVLGILISLAGGWISCAPLLPERPLAILRAE